jgi:hypothetical protein
LWFWLAKQLLQIAESIVAKHQLRADKSGHIAEEGFNASYRYSFIRAKHGARIFEAATQKIIFINASR